MGQDSQECREIHSFTARNQITLVVGLVTVQSKWSLYQIVWPWLTNTAVTEQDKELMSEPHRLRSPREGLHFPHSPGATGFRQVPINFFSIQALLGLCLSHRQGKNLLSLFLG